MADYHESIETLDEKTKDCTRALNSLKEEVEAVDWYNQRINTSIDDKLKSLMTHNRDEEIEHVCMILEWLRKNMPVWDEELRKNLFVDEVDNNSKHNDLNIGNLK